MSSPSVTPAHDTSSATAVRYLHHPADFDVEWDRRRVDTEGFAGVLKQFPPQRAFANAFCEFSNLGKDGIEVEASLVVVHPIDEILNSQIDYMCETWNMTKLQSADPLK